MTPPSSFLLSTPSPEGDARGDYPAVTRHTLFFIIYAIWALTVTSVHALPWLGVNLLFTFAFYLLLVRPLSWKLWLPLALFNGALSAVYGLALWYGWYSSWEPIIRLNLRTFGLLSGTLLFVRKVDPFRIFPRAARWNALLVLILSQVFQYRRLWREFQLALESRTIVTPPWRQRFSYTLRMTLYFFIRAFHQGAELSLGLQSRGFHLD